MDRVDHTAKLSKQVISRSVDYSASVLLDKIFHYFFMSIKGSNGSQFILPQETTVTLHICTEDGSKLTPYFLDWHGIPQSLGGREV
jgi:hypothetical protein